MNNMNNVHEDGKRGLVEKMVCSVGDKLAGMAVDGRGCFMHFFYEPELSSEIIHEMINQNR